MEIEFTNKRLSSKVSVYPPLFLSLESSKNRFFQHKITENRRKAKKSKKILFFY
jgi:hypothetical protein